MFGLVNSDAMDTAVYEEFDRLERSVSGFLITEHYENGTHNLEPAGLGFINIGTIVLWPLSTAPDGWQLCNGSNISRTRYVALFGVIGTAYGVGDGSTTYTLPLEAGPGSFSYIIFSGLGT